MPETLETYEIAELLSLVSEACHQLPRSVSQALTLRLPFAIRASKGLNNLLVFLAKCNQQQQTSAQTISPNPDDNLLTMAKKASNQLREPSPSPIPPSSTTAYKTQSSASSSQSHTTSTSAAKGNTAAPSKPISTPSKQASTPSKASIPSKAPTKSSKQTQNIQDIATSIWNRYVDETPQRVKIIDAFMGFLVLLGAVQFFYCVVAGNYVCRCLSCSLQF